jgi:hypothetical protein
VQRTVGFGQAQRQAQQTAGAEGRGVLQTALDATQRSQAQQLKDVSARFTTDLTTLGTTLTQTVTPALVGFANAALMYAELLGHAAGMFGDTVGMVARQVGQSGVWSALTGNNLFARGLREIATPAWITDLIKGEYNLVQKLTAPPATPAVYPATFMGPIPAGATRAPLPPPQLTLPVGFIGPVPAGERRAPVVLPAGTLGPLLPGERRAAPTAQLPPTFIGPLAPGETRMSLQQAATRARQEAALRAALAPAARRGARAGIVGPELIRPLDRGQYDPLALFNAQRATWGTSIVQLAGGQADTARQQIRILQQALAKDDQQLAFLREVVRQLQLGNALSQTQARELDHLGLLLGSTANNPPPPGRAHGRQLTAGVR